MAGSGTRWSASRSALTLCVGTTAPVRALSNAAEILSYSVPGQVGLASIISGTSAGTIGVTVPNGTNVSALVATFATSANITSIQVGSNNQTSGATPNNFTSPVTYVVTAEDGTTVKNWTVTVTIQPSTAAEILTYSVPGEVGSAAINSGAGTIGVTVPNGTNVSALVAIFTTSASITSIKVAGVSQVSGTTVNNFTSPVTYVVTAEDGTTVKNWTVTVTIQPSTAAEILTYSVPGEVGSAAINSGAGTIGVTVPNGTNVSARW